MPIRYPTSLPSVPETKDIQRQVSIIMTAVMFTDRADWKGEKGVQGWLGGRLQHGLGEWTGGYHYGRFDGVANMLRLYDTTEMIGNDTLWF